MATMIARLAPVAGMTLTALDGVTLMRANGTTAKAPALYDPCICIAVQGRKRCYLGDSAFAFAFDAQHYMVLSVPLPFMSETEATAAEPLLGLMIRIDCTLLADLLVAIEGDEAPQQAPATVMTTRLDARMEATVQRLLETLASPLEARVLGPGLVREIFYHVLMGEQGGAMRAALTHQGHFGKIARALRRIHQDYQSDLNVTSLACEANMSVPAFHAHFKAVTQCSPIQYVKAARLHKARLLMVRGGVTAASASALVGYESASQFSREFKRMFGRSPVAEAQFMKHTLALMPAAEAGHVRVELAAS
ncbi:AraC family transcriptional regulator [Massilia sp. S19_KUP03_FR1]|uniref:AraC family transcriptional regulator n=1 Tax=Massilia sp. S19_KUP03_FR1 TaxID=3025503 RepID=UPI002FCDD761